MDRPVARPPSDEHWAPDHLVLDRLVLSYAGRLDVERDGDGVLFEHSPLADMAAVEQRYPAWALGPFGRIGPERTLPDQPGVYALVEEGTVRYVGSSRDVAVTFGNRKGIGEISRRDCQSIRNEERCRLNRLILKAARAGRTIDLYLLVTGTRPKAPWFLHRSDERARVELAARLADVTHGTWHLPT